LANSYFPPQGGGASSFSALSGTIAAGQIPNGIVVDAMIGAAAAITLSKFAALGTSKVLVSDGSGVIGVSTVTSATLAFLDATSSIQTQLNGKQASGTYAVLGANTFTGNQDLGANYIGTTDFQIKQGLLNGLKSLILTPKSNFTPFFILAPQTNGSNAVMTISRLTDLTNYEILRIQADLYNTGEFAIGTASGGSGTLRSLAFGVNTRFMSLDTANTITTYVDLIIGSNNLKTTQYNIIENNTGGRFVAGNSIQLAQQLANKGSELDLLPTAGQTISAIGLYRVLPGSYEAFFLGTDLLTAGAFDIVSRQGGGTQRPINVSMQSTKLLSFDIANTITNYVPQIFAGQRPSITAPGATPYTIVSTDDTVIITTGAGAYTVNLPAANAGKQRVTIIKADSGAGAITINRVGADTIEGATSISLATQYKKSTLQSDGTSIWYDLTGTLV
jgi:hypothetical protein